MTGETKTHGYKDLLVWQKGMALVKRIYQMTRSFPSHEKLGLVSQMRRAAISIPSNIAEGQARHTTKEFIQSFLMRRFACGIGYAADLGNRTELLLKASGR